MKVTILVDNIENAGVPGEWGFCAFIEHNGKKMLLDTGASNLFADNAEKLNVSIEDVDMAFLCVPGIGFGLVPLVPDVCPIYCKPSKFL